MRLVFLCVIYGLWAPVVLGAVEPLSYARQSIEIDGEPQTVVVPVGYRLQFLVSLDRPRMLSFHPSGELFIGSKAGHIYRLKPPFRQAEILLSLSGYPHSVATRPGELLIARTQGLFRLPYRAGQAQIQPSEMSLLARLPGGAGHNSRTVAVGPDQRIYLSLGITGNCSDEYLGKGYSFSNWRGGVLRLDETGKNPKWEVFASGLRNPVGFAWHPQTALMYATNNGPDHLGFEQPLEYFSAIRAGSFHGMPWFQYDGKHLFRDQCIVSKPPRPKAEVTTPVALFPARNAPMGLGFVPAKSQFPALQGDAVVALRGSWATRPAGSYFGQAASQRAPKLVVVRFDQGQAQRVDELVTGFQLPDGERWARPVGVATGPDGALYFTSDSGQQGLYRLAKTENPQ